MKKGAAGILISLLIIGTFSGCRQNQEKILGDFLTMLEEPASEVTINAADAYLKQYLPKVDDEYADDMVIRLEQYIEGTNPEGVNYTEWLSQYEKFITPSLSELYQLKEQEQLNPMVVDTVLKISWEELLQRTYDLDAFIQENKTYKEIREDLSWMYSNYVITLVMGTNGTPIFDYKTHAFSESAKLAYLSYMRKYPKAATTWALSEYFTYLESINFTLDYNDKAASKQFFDACDWLVSESGKRVFQVDERNDQD
ncbi:hypothetical protein FRZ06_20225 [Anoxybacterium hadale]|uniref:Uncharacterized protein n=1 Tax=Anoxybacterium hadale TaxID=3408580 RepID=A0ACD1AHC5_9FIRM|nr:hypothetical protein FRZ06_20225 [Clostridiales bacterium]